MSFRDLLDSASAQALADHLSPTETSVFEKYCREYSSRFHTPLLDVMALDPYFVARMVNSDNLSEFNASERMEDLFDMLGSLGDENYDAKKEKAIRDEMAQIEERERLRLERGEAIHPSLEKDKRVIVKDQPPKPKELPKSGGINMGLVNQLMNSDKEG
jgi:hypothetical protein